MDRRQSLMALALERDLRTHLRINLLPRCDAMDEYYCVALLCVEIETKILTKKELFGGGGQKKRGEDKKKASSSFTQKQKKRKRHNTKKEVISGVYFSILYIYICF